MSSLPSSNSLAPIRLLMTLSCESGSSVDDDASSMINEGMINEGTINEGTTNEGITNEGITNEGTTNEGTTNEGTINEGTINEGTLAPIRLLMTLSCQTGSSVDDDASNMINEGMINEGTINEGTINEGTTNEDTINEGTINESTINESTIIESTINESMIQRPVTSSQGPKRSGPHNLRRDGYSEDKCRYVLVKYCSGIPRNFNYAEGVQLVYERLREHCGDENLDLSIGVLYEFIEVDTQFTFEPGAAFRRWQFDHSRRAVDLTNNHAPRMGNIIVGNIMPTERLRQWRIQNPDRQRGMKLSDSDSASPASRSSVATVQPHFGIVHRSAWHIENTLYVSSRSDGTRVKYCPSPQEVHERAWNDSFGRGGRLIGERRVFTPDATIPLDFEEPDIAKSSKKKKVLEIFLHVCTGSVPYMLKLRLPRGPFTIPSFRNANARFDYTIGRHGGFSVPEWSVPEYEGLEEVRNLPDPDSEEGKSYYRNIKTTRLPDGVEIPNAMFGRKHDLMLYNEANEGQVPGRQNRMRSVEDLAIQRCLDAYCESERFGKRWTYRGPMTAMLFKDSGIDYQWKVPKSSEPERKQRAGNSSKVSFGSYLSDKKPLIDEEAALSLPASPARCQRARSMSKRALQGDMMRHVCVTRTVNEKKRPYAAWNGHGTQAHLFSGNPGASSSGEAVGMASRQGRFNNPDPISLESTGFGHLIGQSEVGSPKRSPERVKARRNLLKKIVNFGGDGADDNVDVGEEEKSSLATTVYKENNNNNVNHKFLEPKHHSQLPTSILHSPFIRKLSISLEHNISTLTSKVAECGMASPQRETEKIQVDGVFLLKSPVPLTIRKLSGDTKAQENSQGSSSRQKQSKPLESMREEAREQHHTAKIYPPRTSSRCMDGTAHSPQSQRLRRKTESAASHSGSGSNTHSSDDSFMGNFVAVDASQSTLPTTSSSSRDKGPSRKIPMEDTTARYREDDTNPYEFQDSPEVRHLTTMTTVHDILSRKFEEDTATSPPRHITERPHMPNQDSRPWSASKVTRHAKNSSFSVNADRVERRDALNRSPTYASRRAEYQQEEFPHGYGLHRVKSSPAIGVQSHPAPSPEINSYAAYETYENDDRYSGPDVYTGGYHFSGSRDLTATPTSRGRQSRAKGLGIDSVERLQQDVERGERDRVEVFINPVPEPLPARKRSRSPMKKLFGPGGLLGNTGAPNSPADPRYVKQKSRHGMVSKLKTKIEEFAEIPRSMSPIKNMFKAEEKSEEKPSSPSKFPVSLSPPRQAKLYMELELLICATTNNFLMDQYKAGRMSTESIKKIVEFWKNKGRPQVIEFQYDQATQRDLIVANQREFQFHGDNATNALQVNAMLYSWKQNAREMSVRTWCWPDTVIQKQLHDTYRMFELLGAGVPTFLALQDIHKEFNKQVQKAFSARRNREIMTSLPILPSPSRGATKDMFFNTPAVDSPEKSTDHITDWRAHIRHQSDIARASADDPLYPSKMHDPYYVAPTVKRGPYADQSEALDDYHSSQAAQPGYSDASQFPNASRRGPAAIESRHQQGHYDDMSHSSKAAEQSNQYDRHDSSTSYSSRASGSRYQSDHPDSSTSYSSQAANSRVRPEDRNDANSYYSQQTQPRHHGSSNSYSTQVANARMQSDQRGSADSYSSRTAELRNPNSNNHDYANSRRGAVSPSRRAAKPAGNGHRRAPSEDSDDFSSFGKYGVGL